VLARVHGSMQREPLTMSAGRSVQQIDHALPKGTASQAERSAGMTAIGKEKQLFGA